MNGKKIIKNSFFELVFFITSFLLSFFRAIKLFILGKNFKKNKFFSFLDFIFRKWPKYFWKKPSLYKISSLP
jgi:hypothetical protein